MSNLINPAQGKYQCSKCREVREYSVVLPYSKTEILKKLGFKNTRYGARCNDKVACAKAALAKAEGAA
jgi:hypothetical protein